MVKQATHTEAAEKSGPHLKGQNWKSARARQGRTGKRRKLEIEKKGKKKNLPTTGYLGLQSPPPTCPPNLVVPQPNHTVVFLDPISGNVVHIFSHTENPITRARPSPFSEASSSRFLSRFDRFFLPPSSSSSLLLSFGFDFVESVSIFACPPPSPRVEEGLG